MITLSQNQAPVSVPVHGRRSAVADHYFSLVHWLRSVGDRNNSAPKVIGVTGCSRGAGVSTVSANLAVAAAQVAEEPVLLLDMSLGRPRLAKRSGSTLELRRGSHASELPWSECVAKSSVANLSLLSVRSLDDPQSLSTDAHQVSDLLDAIEKEFGFIVVDMPTVESSLCFVTAGSMNGILLVMEAERTHWELAMRAKQRLIDARATVLGVILNNHRQHMPRWLETRL